MKFRRNLTAAALVLALHAGLLVLLDALSLPLAQQSTSEIAPALSSTVVVLLATLPTQSTPRQKPASKPKNPPANATAQSHTTADATAALAPELPSTSAVTAVTLATAPNAAEGKPAPLTPLDIGTRSLQSAAREADKNTVRRLALQSGKIDGLETATPHPIALVAAEASVPRCPPATQLRESVGPQGYALTRDRRGDCEDERKAKVRAFAVGR